MPIAGQLTKEQVSQNVSQSLKIRQSADPDAIAKDRFVFFAAFDGTNNDKENLSQDSLKTNVAVLSELVDMARTDNRNLDSAYYPGPGTAAAIAGSAALPSAVTAEAIATAKKAYDDFSQKAAKWLAANPAGSVTTAVTSFSRGYNAAAVFSQLLYQQGLKAPDGNVLIPPGQVGISAGVIYDPVSTGMSGNLALPGASNVTVMAASNEYRYLFKLNDLSGQPGVDVNFLFGNHCDIGGTYHDKNDPSSDHGLSALTLQTGVAFLQNSGLAIPNPPANRQFDPDQPQYVHTEDIDSYDHQQWSAYGTFGQYTGPRLTDRLATAPTIVQHGGTSTASFTDFSGQLVTYTKSDAAGAGAMTVRRQADAAVLET